MPFYRELEEDLAIAGAKLVNSYAAHTYLADCRSWIRDLRDLTPGYTDRLETLPETGQWVIKGVTNSRKHAWNRSMFADSKRRAIEIASELMSDSLIGTQDIVARPYVPLKKLGEGINGMPVSNEFRFFVFDKQILSGGFYWASHLDEGDPVPQVPDKAIELAVEVTKRDIPARFYCVDVAETEKGDWIVIELNDGQMSGLSCNNPYTLYENMARVLNGAKSTYV